MKMTNQTSTTATAPTTAADYLTSKDDGFPKEENGRIYADAYDLIGTETTTTLTGASKNLFVLLAEDAGNWSGTPMLDISTAERGNLTQLKKAGLLTTFRSDGLDFVDFTDAGLAFASTLGIEISK